MVPIGLVLATLGLILPTLIGLIVTAAVNRREIEGLKVQLGLKADKAQVSPVFKVVGGPYDGQKALVGVFSFGDETAAGIAFQNLRGFGFGKDYFDAGGGIESIAQDLPGRQARCRGRGFRCR